MHPFTLTRADDPAEAVEAHARDPQLAYIAGGTDLLGLMKDRVTFPERLLDVNGLPGMREIEALADGGLRIGALARMSDVANADIPELDIVFVGGFDEEASPLGTKGIGELTATSVAPAIANAVYHATGKRVRDLPITVEKLL